MVKTRFLRKKTEIIGEKTKLKLDEHMIEHNCEIALVFVAFRKRALLDFSLK